LAYLEDGYSQIEIVNYLGLSKSAVSLIIKKLRFDGRGVGFMRVFIFFK
jgi:predicted transcriptional regulator